MDSLAEHVIPLLVKELDPHSVYIPASEMQALNEPLEGEFDGIGVVFNMATDTVIVLNVIPQGPSDKAGDQGRRPYHRDRRHARRRAERSRSDDVVKKCCAARAARPCTSGSDARASPTWCAIDVVRGEIPIRSVESAFRIADGVGYVKLGQFARTTFDEIPQASLAYAARRRALPKLIFDLRGNSGGFLDQAIAVANEFLHEDQLIVYTEDRQSQTTARIRRRHGRRTGHGCCGADRRGQRVVERDPRRGIAG